MIASGLGSIIIQYELLYTYFIIRYNIFFRYFIFGYLLLCIVIYFINVNNNNLKKVG